MGRATPVQMSEAIEYLKTSSPGLLIDGENIHMAVTEKKDYAYFTSHRILIIENTGVTGKQIEHRSVAYHAIRGFTIETAGAYDDDSEFKLFADDVDIGIDFDRDLVNIYDFQTYISDRVFAKTEQAFAVAAPVVNRAITASQTSNLNHLLGMLNQLKKTAPLEKSSTETHLRALGALMSGEKVELVSAHHDEMLVCTSDRILLVKAKMEKKKLEFVYLRYSVVRGYSVQIPHNSDEAAVLWMLTNLSVKMRCLKHTIPAGIGNIIEVQEYFNHRILGDATAWMPQGAKYPIKLPVLDWDVVSHVDASEMNHHFHSSPPILQDNEVCHVAFKDDGELIMLTTKRVLVVDARNPLANIVYNSFPYSSIKMFEIKCGGWQRTPGENSKWRLGMYTDICYEPSEGKDENGKKLRPKHGFSFLDFRLDRNTTDVLAVHRYISAKVLPLQAQCSLKKEVNAATHVVDFFSPDKTTAVATLLSKTPEGSLNKLVDFVAPTTLPGIFSIDSVMAADGLIPVLHPREEILLVYKCGKNGQDALLFTSFRILDIDLQSGGVGPRASVTRASFRSSRKLNGRVKPRIFHYRSIPYSSIRSYTVQAKMTFSLDSELKLNVRAPWHSKVRRNFGIGDVEADIVSIDSLLSTKVLGKAGEPSDFLHVHEYRKSAPTMLPKFVKELEKSMDADVQKRITEWLKSSVPLLQANEKIEVVYRKEQEYTIMTSHRVILLDTSTDTETDNGGKETITPKVKFSSYPYKYIDGFSCRTTGFFGQEKSAKMYTSEDLKSSVKRKFGEDCDLFVHNNMLGQHILQQIGHEP